MRIAYISTDFGIPVHGNKGASIHVREMAAALAADGHEVEIFTSRRGGEAPRGFDVPVHEIRLNREERRLIAALQDDPAAGEAVAKETRSMLFATSFRHQVLPMLREMQPDAIYERYALLGTAGSQLARDLGIPHILEVNAPLSEEHARHRGSAYGQTVRAMERRTLASPDQVLAVSEPLKRWIVDTGVDAERVTVLPNGVNLSRFAESGREVRDRLGLGARPVVGFVGTLKAWHGTATLVRAVGSLARERGLERAPYLLIVGDGPERERLQQVAHDEAIDDLVVFTGSVPHDEMGRHIAAMDVAVAPYDEMPSFYFSPLKLFEYMAAGRSIVAAAIGQVETCIRHGETGLLYPPGDAGALAAGIASLVDEPARARAIGDAARVDAETNHGWERNARVVMDLIEATRARVGVAAEGVTG